jgi:serine/threonine-protein kinase RsbW
LRFPCLCQNRYRPFISKNMERVFSLRIAAKLDNLRTIRRFVEEKAGLFTTDSETIGDLILATDEAVTNIIVHGYKKLPGTIEVEVKQQDGEIAVCLRDQAPPFDPTRVPVPDTDVPIAQRRLGGMGVHMMRHFLDRLTYQVTPEGENELTLVKWEKARK